MASALSRILEKQSLDKESAPNPAIAAKERVRAILENPENLARWAALPVRPEKKKSGKADFNKLSHDYMRERGYWAVRADYWDDRLKRQHDFLGIFDFVCLGKLETVGLQITSVAHMADRRKKIVDSKGFGWVKDAGWKVLVLGWSKNQSGHWTAREEWL